LTRAGKIFPVLKVGIASLAENWKIKTSTEKTNPDDDTPMLFDITLNKMTIKIPIDQILNWVLLGTHL
jgi:hypothetical protein